jgi:hypothetical protein
MTLVYQNGNVEIRYKGLTELPPISLYTYTMRKKDKEEPSIPSEFLTDEIKKKNIHAGDGIGFCTVWDKYLNVYVWERKKILLHFGYIVSENGWIRSNDNDIGCIDDLKIIELEHNMLEQSGFDYPKYQKLHS